MTGLEQLAEVAAREQVYPAVYYVAHPLRPTEREISDVASLEAWRWTTDEAAASIIRENLRRAKRWLQWLRDTYPASTFIAPWITAIESGADDRDPEERARGLRDNVRVIRLCTGVVLCGGRVSSGMQQEADAASNVIDLTALGPEPPR